MKRILIISILILLAVGCAKEPAVEEQPSTEADVTDVETGISDVGVLDEELDTAELDDFEKELDNIDW